MFFHGFNEKLTFNYELRFGKVAWITVKQKLRQDIFCWLCRKFKIPSNQIVTNSRVTLERIGPNWSDQIEVCLPSHNFESNFVDWIIFSWKQHTNQQHQQIENCFMTTSHLFLDPWVEFDRSRNEYSIDLNRNELEFNKWKYLKTIKIRGKIHGFIEKYYESNPFNI